MGRTKGHGVERSISCGGKLAVGSFQISCRDLNLFASLENRCQFGRFRCHAHDVQKFNAA